MHLDPGRLAPDEALPEAPLVLRIVEEAARRFAGLAAAFIRRPGLPAALLLVT